MHRVIGIDFGTSTTYMNVKRYHGDQPVEDKFSYMPVMFNYGESSGYVASIVRENADGSFDFGEKAAEQFEGATIYTEIKMLLESPDEEQRAMARRIMKEFFKFLYETYTQQATNLGGADDTEETVISYPVKWQAETAEFMLDAARTAGFRNVRGMDEATAAVSTVLCHDTGKGLLYLDKPGYLMLIDMGAGTTDLVICKYAARTGGGIDVELVTSWPQSADEPTFGGREIDAVLEGYVEDYLTKSLNPALAPMAHNFATIPGQAKKWKELNVSVNLAAGKPVTVCGYISAYGPMLSGSFPAFDRKGFEEMIRSGLQDYTRLVKDCLAKTAELDSGFAAAGLDLVILTGGHSAWYFAREIIDGTMAGYLNSDALKAVRDDKRRVVSLPNPQTTVSLGLVYSKLPFQLAKKPEQIQQQKAEQEVPVQPSAEDVMPAETEFNLEAFYLHEARNFFSEKTCDLQAVHFALTRLNISGEELFWAEGINKGVADPGTYAVTESGIYLQGAFGGKYHLPWTEFVSAEWASRAFVAPEWANKNNWEDFVPLVVKLKKGPLKELHNHLRSLAVMKNSDRQVKDAQQQQKELVRQAKLAQPATQTPAGQYKWDDRLLPIVKAFIQNDATLSRSNCLIWTTVVANMRSSFGLPAGDEIYYTYTMLGELSKGDRGTIIAASGLWDRSKIFWSYVDNHFTWEMFLNSDIETQYKNGNEVLCQIARYGERRFVFIGGDAMSRLQTLLREKSVALQDGRPI